MMSYKNRILFQEKDIKTQKIIEHLPPSYKVIPAKRSILFFPIFLKELVMFGKPCCIIFRYLNDYPSIFKTLIKKYSEALTIYVAKFLGIKIHWICHNIDKESRENFPKHSHSRRNLLLKYSMKIFVTDPLLLEKGKEKFTEYENKIDYITFGNMFTTVNNSLRNKKIHDLIFKFIEDKKQKSIETAKFVLCAGRINWKTAHFEKIPSLIEYCKVYGYDIYIVIVGDISKSLIKDGNYSLYNYFIKNPNILFIDKFISIDEYAISKYIDFYWRIYLDNSVPGTLYHSASLKIPILTFNKGFLGYAVKKYQLGEIVKEDFSNIKYVLKKIENWDKKNAEKFLETHNWHLAVNKIIDSI